MTDDCLTGETVVQLHLHASSGCPITLESSLQQSHYNIKITATQWVSHTAQNKEVELKILRKQHCIHACAKNHNETFQDSDFFIYSTSTVDVSSLVFQIDVHRCINDVTAPAGHGYLTSSQMTSSTGSVIVTLQNDNNQYLGTISVGYLLIRPWQHPLANRKSVQPRWLRGISGMRGDGQYHVSGHRGAGESFSGPSQYPENTISAFKAASRLGIDYVEMDVQVSKDRIPVVFHDTTVKLSLQDLPSPVILEVPVKDLTIEQMQNAKVAGIKEHQAYLKAKEETQSTNNSLNCVEMDFKLFPALSEVFDEVPEETGFLVELKYPLAELGGASVDAECLDENEFVDAILQVVYEKAKNRKVILASFDANICVMCQLKQNDYPVYFITQDNTQIWTPYLDMRTRHIQTAVAVAKAHHLDGIHSFANELLNCPEKIDMVLEAGLVLSVWGSANEKLEIRQWLHERGVQCIQVDNIFTGLASNGNPSNGHPSNGHPS